MCQLFASCSPAVPAVRQLFASCSPAVRQLFASCSPAVRQLFASTWKALSMQCYTHVSVGQKLNACKTFEVVAANFAIKMLLKG